MYFVKGSETWFGFKYVVKGRGPLSLCLQFARVVKVSEHCGHVFTKEILIVGQK